MERLQTLMIVLVMVTCGTYIYNTFRPSPITLNQGQVDQMSKPVNVRVDGPINTTPVSAAPQAPIYVIVVPQAPAPVPEAKPKPARSKPPEKILTVRHPEPSDQMRRFYDGARRGDPYALPRQY